MTRQAIRNTSSGKPVPPRVFDLILDDDDDIYLEVKIWGKHGEKHFETVLLSDVLSQVEDFIDANIRNK